jgi:hypothetical protein
MRMFSGYLTRSGRTIGVICFYIVVHLDEDIVDLRFYEIEMSC